MSSIRIPGNLYKQVRAHLSPQGWVEHFAFLFAKWEQVGDEHIFIVQDIHLVDEGDTTSDYRAYEVAADQIVDVVNRAVKGGFVVIEAHNHGGQRPRFSTTDEDGLAELMDYIHSSLPGRPYIATVWGADTAFGEIFLPGGSRSVIRSIVADGDAFRQVVSRDDDTKPIDPAFSRQLAWLGQRGQRELSRMRIAVVGIGGTGSLVTGYLAHLGIRDFVVIDHDLASDTNMNRLVTASAADIGKPKTELAARKILEVAPGATVQVLELDMRDPRALAALREVDVIFGCVDNDGARVVLDELARAYRIPFFDLGVGIEVDPNGAGIEAAGGRLAVSLPDGPCLTCMGEIDTAEAHYFMSSPEERDRNIRLGYVKNLDVPAPSVIGLNATIAGMAITEFMAYCAGNRSVNPLTELDVLGGGRPVPSQWMTPSRVNKKDGCFNCSQADKMAAAAIDRYALRSPTLAVKLVPTAEGHGPRLALKFPLGQLGV